ncbi:hypothetical protein ABPG77_005069 [Micractinium sp. CCAP 211/92]
MGSEAGSSFLFGRQFRNGSWAIGLFLGPSPLGLAPYQQAQQPSRAQPSIAFAATGSAAPHAPTNPILTCASVTQPPSNFVADPFLWLGPSSSSPPSYASEGPTTSAAAGNASLAGTGLQMHVFFETKTNTDMQGDIAAARSDDGGASWHVLGIVLDEPWHLSYPFVFEWGGKMYMLPEGHASGSLRLYVADDFPLRWRFHSALLPRPMIDASLVQWQGRWYLFASDVRTPFDLELFVASSLLGPWQPHPLSPVQRRGRATGARMAGRLALHGGQLLRFGQDCGKTYGHRLVAYRIDELSPAAFRQTRVPLRFDRQPWSAARHHHLDAQQLPDGSWLAVADGDWQSSAPISGRLIRDLLWLAALWALLLALWAHARLASLRQHFIFRGGGGSSGGGGTAGVELARQHEVGMAGLLGHGSSSGGVSHALCQPLAKTDFRRHGTAERPLAPSTDQRQCRPHPGLAPLPPPKQTNVAPQTAKGAKWELHAWLFTSFGSWQRKLIFGGMLTWSTVLSFRAGNFLDAWLLALLALFIILNPLGAKW